MKKLFLLLVTFTIIAQPDAQTGMWFGLKGGLNIADIAPGTKTDLAHSSRISFNAGVFARFHLKKHFALQPELLFSGQGTKAQLDHGADVIPRYENNDWVFKYLSLPVVLQYSINDRVSVETGPQVGKLLSAKVESSHEAPFDLRDYSKAFDFSWNFRTTYLSKMGLGGGLGYNIGLNNINKSPDYIYRNRVWQFYVLYAIKK